jgi:sulfur carrier protein
MKVFINDKEHHLNGEHSLAHLLSKTMSNTNGIAVAVNNAVVAKNDWNTFQLNDNDKVIIIKATQGG